MSTNASQDHPDHSSATPWKPRAVALARGTKLASLPLCAGLLLSGCNVDSFFDPSVTGRWEYTPTSVPILERISAIEDDTGEYVEKSPVSPEDLIPEVDTYRIAPGDFLVIEIRDFLVIGVAEQFERNVDLRGYIDLPRLDPIKASGKTQTQLVEAIRNAIRDAQILDNPTVVVNLRSQRNQTFSIFGGVANAGLYQIPEADYRLLEALTAAGTFDETAQEVQIIRQVPLSDTVSGRALDEPATAAPSNTWNTPSRPATPARPAADEPKKGEDLIDLIDELSRPKDDGEAAPGLLGVGSAAAAQPTRSPPAPAEPEAAAPPPAIDLPDAAGNTPANPDSPTPSSRSGWRYQDGRWIKSGPPVELAEGANPLAGQPTAKELVTQRVIAVPMAPLIAGAAEYNIVVRPGDIIRVPRAESGLVYMAGFVNRPGPYSLPVNGRLTLQRAVDAAGGLSSLAMPERVDITRIVGPGRQATIRVNYRAIAEGTQPDIYIKPDDRINFGTNFYAYPLAVLRSGLRASYGFGFTLDRNFADEVFGVFVQN